MLRRRRGHIVNVSSLAGVPNMPGTAVYGSTKAALTHFTGGPRAELKGTGVGVTVVEAGPVDTAMWRDITAAPAVLAAARRFERLQLLPTARPERLAATIVRAVQAERSHVRTPRRCLSLYALEDLPRRLAAAMLVGVDVPRRVTSSAVASPAAPSSASV